MPDPALTHSTARRPTMTAATPAIDVTARKYIPAAKLARLVPRPDPDDHPLTVGTLLRWRDPGRKAVDGRVVKLPLVRIGGCWYGSVEDLNQFFFELSTPATELPAVRSPAVRRREDAEAGRVLDREGVTC